MLYCENWLLENVSHIQDLTLPFLNVPACCVHERLGWSRIKVLYVAPQGNAYWNWHSTKPCNVSLSRKYSDSVIGQNLRLMENWSKTISPCLTLDSGSYMEPWWKRDSLGDSWPPRRMRVIVHSVGVCRVYLYPGELNGMDGTMIQSLLSESHSRYGRS